MAKKPYQTGIVAVGGGRKVKGGMGGRSVAEKQALLGMQQVDFEAALIEERDEDITNIAAAISEVNETMRDLAQIVDEQGKNIDNIEVNVTSAEAHTTDGVQQLEKAEKHQRGYRKWIIMLLVIIIVAAGGIAGIIIWKNRPNNSSGGGGESGGNQTILFL